MIKTREEYLSLSNGLWIVLERSVTMAAMVPLPSQAFENIKSNGGLDTEQAYPYTGKDETCKFSAENVDVQVLDSVNISISGLPLVQKRISELEEEVCSHVAIQFLKLLFVLVYYTNCVLPRLKLLFFSTPLI
ncbi:Peptidase C1A papain C-terminal [Arabidopsis suecica]|uniref:Peptidase C1A papain C-terminal n=1 Tax=Arabidopsis suecica TaxID=45249 RepID=A0A8T2BUY9_ARASU|nr:Peptidase C1A papain C-terminal [Arabidopsis suecica]KAG7590080.1 Peptidase C1A papain C-terminal [Arabidopsis suecica]